MAEHVDATSRLDEHIPDRRIGWSRNTSAAAVCVAATVALAALGGWTGYRELRLQHDRQTRTEMLTAASQGAVDLTTIDVATVDADVKRILDASAGTFHDDFAERSQPFVDAVKQAKSKTEGTVTAAALESLDGSDAKVLVAVSVATSNAGQDDPGPRSWRMRISVHKSNDTVKVTDVQFVS